MCTCRRQFGGKELLNAQFEMGIGEEFRVPQAPGEFEQLLCQRPPRPQVSPHNIGIAQPMDRAKICRRVGAGLRAQVDRSPGGTLRLYRAEASAGPKRRHQSRLKFEFPLVALRCLRQTIEHFDAAR